jgi:hypothetical protein
VLLHVLSTCACQDKTRVAFAICRQWAMGHGGGGGGGGFKEVFQRLDVAESGVMEGGGLGGLESAAAVLSDGQSICEMADIDEIGFLIPPLSSSHCPVLRESRLSHPEDNRGSDAGIKGEVDVLAKVESQMIVEPYETTGDTFSFERATSSLGGALAEIEVQTPTEEMGGRRARGDARQLGIDAIRGGCLKGDQG